MNKPTVRIYKVFDGKHNYFSVREVSQHEYGFEFERSIDVFNFYVGESPFISEESAYHSALECAKNYERKEEERGEKLMYQTQNEQNIETEQK